MTGSLRIVIVEDNHLIAMDLEELLDGMGHQVCAVASTEAEAEAAAAQWRPDLMIVDAGLHGGSGVAAMSRILAVRDVAHFYMTGNPWAVVALVPEAIIVTKPFTMRELSEGMASARDAARLRRIAGDPAAGEPA